MEIAKGLREPLKQQLGLDQEIIQIFRWLWGFSVISARRGVGICDEQYAKSCIFVPYLFKNQSVMAPKMGLNSFHPSFKSFGKCRFDRIRVNRG